MTSLTIACALLACLLCITIGLLARTKSKLRRSQNRVKHLEAKNSQAFEWGRSVGVAKGVSGRWLRFETDGLFLKHIDIVTETNKHN